jgi:molecular chaperone DnaJ
VSPQRDWFEKDFYKVLGVASDAPEKEITKAYRKLARQLHPDRNPGDPTAEERFKEVAAAYDVLGDAAKRAEYDEVRRLGPVGAGFRPGPGGFGPGAGGTFNFDAGDLGDLLGGLFGRGRRGPTGPQRGDDLEAELHLSFEDAANGVTTTVHLTSDVPCQTCHGSGAKPGTMPKPCARCGGRGVLDDNQGLFSFSQPCARCGGRGRVVEDPCPTCGGRGIERRPRQVKVRIPPGVGDNQTIRLKGRGGPGRNGGPPGDLFVRVRVAEHPLFGRRGDAVTLTVPVTFPEAALGADVTVPTLDGPVTVRIPPGTPSGKTLRVKGRGVPTAKGRGDLLVTVEVAVPKRLTAAQRKAVEALAASTHESPRQHLGV